MLRCLVVDDEPWARAALRRLLDERNDAVVAGEAGSVASTVAALAKLAPDLLFLDIQLRGESAFELFKEVTVRCPVIFLTAHDEHALQAFDVNAVDYVVKPVRRERLSRAIDRASRYASLPKPERGTSSVALTDAGAIHALNTNEILYIDVEHIYTTVHLTNGRSLVTREGLASWEQRLPEEFFRIHRGAIVNLRGIEALEPERARWILRLRSVQKTLPVSRRRVQALKAALRQLLDRKGT
ncbi:MAG: LytTR family DNA-binding domain-containing protein [Myxococcota bacterium]